MSQPPQHDLIGKTLNNEWRVKKRLGGGSFGEIFVAEHQVTGEECAVKVESRTTKHPQLIYEAKIVKYIGNTEGLCRLNFAYSDLKFNYMGVDKLGPSLEDQFNRFNRRFSLKTICLIGIQMIKRVEYLHSKTFIHRDIKPDNFLIGEGLKNDTVYIIDFGLAKRYKDPRTQTHIPYRDDKSLTGTARYASLNAHKGIEQSRRDDLESIGFVLMYFVRKGVLPWQGIRADKKNEKYKLIEEKKNATSIRALCKNAPPAFAMYLHYVRGLRFDTKPDYNYLIDLFVEQLHYMGTDDDNIFDWIPAEEQRRTSSKQIDARHEENTSGIRARPQPLPNYGQADPETTAGGQPLPRAVSANVEGVGASTEDHRPYGTETHQGTQGPHIASGPTRMVPSRSAPDRPEEDRLTGGAARCGCFSRKRRDG